jgi:hypothetical protein
MSDVVTTITPSPAAALSRPGYRDPSNLTRALTALLAASLLLDVAAMVSGIFEYRLLQDIAAGTVEGDVGALAEANDSRQRLIGFCEIGLFIITGITFLSWIYRANVNARALGAEGMKFTPGWSVGWFFVPVASLWKPFQAMREIWQASTLPGNWQAVPNSPVVGWWWALYIGNAILGQLAYRLGSSVDGLDSAMTASTVTTASGVVDLALNAVSIALIARVAANQSANARIAEVF